MHHILATREPIHVSLMINLNQGKVNVFYVSWIIEKVNVFYVCTSDIERHNWKVVDFEGFTSIRDCVCMCCVYFFRKRM